MGTAVTQSGAVMATIGVGAVFFALVLLVAVINAVSSVLNREVPQGSGSARRASGGGQSAAETASAIEAPAVNTEKREASEDRRQRLLLLAFAAFAAHRERSVRVRPPEPVSAWGTGARLQQLR